MVDAETPKRQGRRSVSGEPLRAWAGLGSMEGFGMRANGLLSVWKEERFALNAWLSIGSSYSAEILANLPYNAVTVDLQHGMFDLDTAFSMLQAISTTNAVPMVRVPHNTSWLIQKVQDMGAYGVICPMI